jgi:hypothetical protein
MIYDCEQATLICGNADIGLIGKSTTGPPTQRGGLPTLCNSWVITSVHQVSWPPAPLQPGGLCSEL